jgi:hypothetical protein
VRAAVHAQQLERVVQRPGRLVGARAGQRVEHIGDRRDPAGQRDVLALEPARVAVAVPLLVVGVGDGRGHLERRGVGADEDAVADLRVALHHRELVDRQAPGLEQDAVGDPQLADVVHRAGDAEQLAGRLVEADPAGDQLAVAAHPLQVLPGLVVAKLRRARQTIDRLLLRGPQIDLDPGQARDRVVERRGPLVYRLLELLASAARGCRSSA